MSIADAAPTATGMDVTGPAGPQHTPASSGRWQSRGLRLVIILALAGLAVGTGYVLLQNNQAAPQNKPGGDFAGQAEVLKAGAKAWQSGTEGRLYWGDTLRAVAAVRLILDDSTRVDMEPGTIVVLSEAVLSDGRLVLQQESGRLTVDTNNPLFRLEAPALALTVPHARYRVDVGSGGDTFVQTEQGVVYGQSSSQSDAKSDAVPIAAGESMRTGVAQRLAAQQQASDAILLPAPPPPLPRTPTPTPTATPTPKPAQQIHTIAKGDTLFDLATQYDTTVDAIIKANKLDNPNMLFIGQQLVIPTSK